MIHSNSAPAVLISLQTPLGVFAGDRFGETDTRFTYCAVNALSLLGQLGSQLLLVSGREILD